MDFNKIEHRLYMREGEGSIIGTFRLKKMLKIDIFISLCDNSSHNKAIKLKYWEILKNYIQGNSFFSLR